MNRCNFIAAGVMFCVVATLFSCGEDKTIKPPDIHFGIDACAECSMIVSDERYAAGLVQEAEDGSYESFAFDDVGCMIAYEDSATRTVLARYVRHYTTHEWIDAHTAVYVHSPSLQTPMAFGVAAVSDTSEANALRDELKGDVLDWTQLVARWDAGELSVMHFENDGE